MRAAAWCLVLQLVAASAPAAPPEPPVFYARFPEAAEPGDLESLRRGRVRVQHYPPVDVATFRWERDATTDYTWWMQMQELRFLLPAIDSDNPEDRELAHAWFDRWYDAHMLPRAATERWGEPMSVAYRAMVLVHLVAREEARTDPDTELVSKAKRALAAHQAYLAIPENFDAASNHGIIDAIGLLETTRVVPDTRLRALACTRLETIVGRLVSALGLAREHSPYYHFVVMDWVGEAAAYLRNLPGVPESLVTVLDATHARMLNGAHFLKGHSNDIPQIGDTDSSRVEGSNSGFCLTCMFSPRAYEHCYDPDAGYAIFKGWGQWQSDRRYIVFRIPTRGADLNFHQHDDAMSVYVAYDGATLLGDAGRYSYAPGGARSYFVSQSAHNVVMPASRLAAPTGGVRMVDAVFDRSRADAAVWSARMRQGTISSRRLVTVPVDGYTLEVVDTLRAHGAGGKDGAVLLWNIGEDVHEVQPARFRLKRSEWSWTLRTRGGEHAKLRITVVEGKANVRIARGERDPLLGWYSPSQGVMRPAEVIVVSAPLESITVIRTTLEFPRR